MDFEQPVLTPPDDMVLTDDAGSGKVTPADCRLLAHNVAPDGKANPTQWDDPYFIFLYQHGNTWFEVRGLNPELMSSRTVDDDEAGTLLNSLPYRTVE